MEGHVEFVHAGNAIDHTRGVHMAAGDMIAGEDLVGVATLSTSEAIWARFRWSKSSTFPERPVPVRT